MALTGSRYLPLLSRAASLRPRTVLETSGKVFFPYGRTSIPVNNVYVIPDAADVEVEKKSKGTLRDACKKLCAFLDIS